MLSDMRELRVSVRYPGMQTLRKHKDADSGNSREEKMDEEKYAMESSGFGDEEMDYLGSSKKGSCWSKLKYSGMVQWGQRRVVRFVGQQENNNFEALSGSSVKDTTGLESMEENERGDVRNERKRKRCEEKELTNEAMSNENRTTRGSSMRNQNESSSRQNHLLVYNKKKKRKVIIDRWSAERYKAAEESMLKVLRAKGAVYGKPIMRPALRAEARKLIGDTGLLDHLLKHMAGKVAPSGTERFRRRHNNDGAMEYWLESADLNEVRHEAGVQDPYWSPPPGWKLGDNPSQDPICAEQLLAIREEMSKIKLQMQQLVSEKREEQLAIVTTTDSCVSNDFNLEKGGSFVTIQEMYTELIAKKSKIEEQLKDVSIALADMEELMVVMIKSSSREEQEPTSEGVANANGNANGGDEEETKEEDRAARIERLKSGFRISEREGRLMGKWEKVKQGEDNSVVVPTPTSASSCSSLVKPLAERRPISPATLTHVTMLPPPLINLNESPPPIPPPGPDADAEKETEMEKLPFFPSLS